MDLWGDTVLVMLVDFVCFFFLPVALKRDLESEVETPVARFSGLHARRRDADEDPQDEAGRLHGDGSYVSTGLSSRGFFGPEERIWVWFLTKTRDGCEDEVGQDALCGI